MRKHIALQTPFVWFVFVLFCMWLPAHADTSTFQKGSPEDVVSSLLKFDFNGGVRENPDTYPQWFQLTTHGEPDASKNSPYWRCPLTPVIRSYRIVGKEIISPIKVRVIVEVEMVALGASAMEWLSKDIDKCYLPELSTTIFNSATKEVYLLAHPISATELIGKIKDEKLNVNSYNDKLGGYVRIAKPYRIWQFKVDVESLERWIYVDNVGMNKTLWQISTELLPYPQISLQVAINNQNQVIENYINDIKICSGLLNPPNEYYKRSECPPASFPDKQLPASQIELEMLKSIQGEDK